jgi:hypothetical protein
MVELIEMEIYAVTAEREVICAGARGGEASVGVVVAVIFAGTGAASVGCGCGVGKSGRWCSGCGGEGGPMRCDLRTWCYL